MGSITENVHEICLARRRALGARQLDLGVSHKVFALDLQTEAVLFQPELSAQIIIELRSRVNIAVLAFEFAATGKQGLHDIERQGPVAPTCQNRHADADAVVLPFHRKR